MIKRIVALSIFLGSFCGEILFAKRSDQEVGATVIHDVKTMLKPVCFDLLASSDLVPWGEFSGRINAVKQAINQFEAKYEAELKLDSVEVKPATPASEPVPAVAPEVKPAEVSVPAAEPVPTPAAEALVVEEKKVEQPVPAAAPEAEKNIVSAVEQEKVEPPVEVQAAEQVIAPVEEAAKEVPQAVAEQKEPEKIEAQAAA